VIYAHKMASDRQELHDFLLRACHDMRTRLRAVRTNAELLIEAPEKYQRAERAGILQFLVDGARSADSLVDGILNYVLALQVQQNFSSISTAVLLRGALGKLEVEIRDSGAQISYGEMPQITGDPDRLMQLFENLLRNAIQHRGEAPPCIQVSARLQSSEWLFAIRDNGPGIEAEDLERIFRPFERLRRDHQRAGLGLAICREIVTAHRGRIWAESVVGSGTTVFFALGS